MNFQRINLFLTWANYKVALHKILLWSLTTMWSLRVSILTSLWSMVCRTWTSAYFKSIPRACCTPARQSRGTRWLLSCSLNMMRQKSTFIVLHRFSRPPMLMKVILSRNYTNNQILISSLQLSTCCRKFLLYSFRGCMCPRWPNNSSQRVIKILCWGHTCLNFVVFPTFCEIQFLKSF